MPFTAGVSAERRLSKHFSLEAGLQYNRLDGDHTIHTLAVPVKLNAILASNSRVDFTLHWVVLPRMHIRSQGQWF